MSQAGRRYPKRPQCFALHFIREMFDARVAGTLGEEAFTLLVAVVVAEDAVRYKRPVDFFNDPLRDRCGDWSVSKLARARERAVEGGWLHYRPGSRGEPGVYWVLSKYFPDGEMPEKPRRKDTDTTVAIPFRNEQDRGRITDRIAGGSRRTSNPTLSHPTPGEGVSVGEDGDGRPRERQGAEADQRFRRLFDAYPVKANEYAAAEAFAKLSPDAALYDQMLAALEAQKRSRGWAREDGRFIPYLARWIEGKRWKDLTSPASPPAGADFQQQRLCRWSPPSDPAGTQLITSLRELAPFAAAPAAASPPELKP